MSNRLNRVFGRSLLGPMKGGSQEMVSMPDWAPAVDIVETPEEFVVKAELPEMKKEDVKVSVTGDVLSIEGERKQEKEEKGRKFHRVERTYGTFLRTFALPENVDGAKIRAEFKDGMLQVRMPKTEAPASKTTAIKIS